MAITYRKLAKTLRYHGAEVVRTNGSHEMWRLPSGVTFPVKRTEKEIPTGTLKRIERESGIKF